ncbi:MAG: hypothetical protein WDO71_05270 [Bacteroidota bacterium]
MKRVIMLMGFITHFFSGNAQKIDFNKYPVYNGNDLGLIYTPTSSIFRIWSPPATEAEVILYDKGDNGKELSRYSMTKGKKWCMGYQPGSRCERKILCLPGKNKW